MWRCGGGGAGKTPLRALVSLEQSAWDREFFFFFLSILFKRPECGFLDNGQYLAGHCLKLGVPSL